MGRKSSAKNQPRPAGSEPPPPASGRRTLSPLLLVAGAVVIAAIAILYFRGAQSASEPAQAAGGPQTPVEPPAAAKLGPHPQADLPPLPFDPEPPARPMEVVRAAYKFAAEHPEVLSYVPCYCGCERSGHRGNEDCFVSARDAKGDVTEWEPHGMT